MSPLQLKHKSVFTSEVGPGLVAAHCSEDLLAEAESWQVGLLGTTALQLSGLEEAGAEGGWSWS